MGYTIYLAGGIASGKSTVAEELERLGAWRIDLDRVSREVLEPGSPCVHEVAAAFGEDLLDGKTGELNRALLAERAFATPEAAALLEKIEIPAIRARLAEHLANPPREALDAPCCVVEVPLLDRMDDALDMADEIVVVSLPLAERRVRAISRGMTAADFDARAEKQPTDAWLLAHADTVFTNDGTLEELRSKVVAWWDEHVRDSWQTKGGRAEHGVKS